VGGGVSVRRNDHAGTGVAFQSTTLTDDNGISNTPGRGQQLGRRAAAGLVLEIDIRERLAAVRLTSSLYRRASGMGFNRRKLVGQRHEAAEKEAAKRRATDAQVLEEPSA